jgi:multiple sugar transport system substrate-binding protein
MATAILVTAAAAFTPAAAQQPATPQQPQLAQAQFDWRRFNGTTINLLLNNHPWSQAVRGMANEFTQATGIRTRIEIFNEEQFRARLTTIMQARSADIDVFMSLKPREGELWARAGWYANLTPMLNDASLTAPDYNWNDFGEALRNAETINGQVVGVPLNLEGPLFYWRRDIFARCNVPVPETAEDIAPAAQRIKACVNDASFFAFSSRGLRGALPYTFAPFLFNLGGAFADAQGRSTLCSPASLRAIDYYANLIRNYGPPGSANYTFTQIIEVMGQGRAAMIFESSNEFANLMRHQGRANDLGVKVMPRGRETGISRPVVIGWGLSVSAHSRQQQAAWYFLQWVTSRATQTRLIQAGVAPPRTSVFQGEEFQRWVAEQPIRQQWANALVEIARTGTSIYQIPTERVPEARELSGNAVQRVILGQASAQDAACQADQELNRLAGR